MCNASIHRLRAPHNRRLRVNPIPTNGIKTVQITARVCKKVAF
jgi:hypothetical protein